MHEGVMAARAVDSEIISGATVDDGYQPPMMIRLGTLSELTLGGGAGTDDGVGGFTTDAEFPASI